MTIADPTGKAPNPFVGPRAFQQGESIYGRNREIPQLRDLLIAERKNDEHFTRALADCVRIFATAIGARPSLPRHAPDTATTSIANPTPRTCIRTTAQRTSTDRDHGLSP